jgi:hypothetical protein
MIFMLNKVVSIKNNMENKVLGAYRTQMEEINKASGMEIYNLDKKSYTQEELEILKEVF